MTRSASKQKEEENAAKLKMMDSNSEMTRVRKEVSVKRIVG